MIKNTLTLFSLAFIILLAPSCNNGVDTQKPDINLIEPNDEDHFSPGDTINFECQFEDNEALKSYKIEIHFNADGHTHKSSMKEPPEVLWQYKKTWDFDQGVKNILIKHREFIIPETIDGLPLAEGDYHLGIYVTDVSGNENHLFINIEIGQEAH